MAGAMSAIHCMLVAASLTQALGAPFQDFSDYSFERYLDEFGKSYPDDPEKALREQIFNVNLEIVQSHNKEYSAGAQTWWMEMNVYADWTKEELAKLFNGRRKMMDSAAEVVDLLQENRLNAESIDWREKNAVTPVKDQGGCGSCWAFSAIQTVESHHAIATGQLIELAPQAYVNCVKNPHECGGTGGCSGATMELAFNLTRDVGVPLEVDLPYKGKDEKCSPYTAAVKASGYVKLPVNNAQALETALATKGPVSVAVAAGPWMLYGGGVFNGCSKNTEATLDHGVQAVGYSKDYWIVRNSWGAGWGERGYIRLSRSSDAKTFKDSRPAEGSACKPYPKEEIVGGECGILFDTSYPTGVTATRAVDNSMVI